MINVNFSDGSINEFPKPLTISDIATSYDPKKTRTLIAGAVDNISVNTDFLVCNSCSVDLITIEDDRALSVLRQSCSYLLAKATQQLFPKAKVIAGGLEKDGFYYDFIYEDGFTADDLILIEQQMHQLIRRNIPILNRKISNNEAAATLHDTEHAYNLDIIETLYKKESLSLYRAGDFEHLCKGPLVSNTGFLKAFKINKISGAYWCGSAENIMLQRIHGTCWRNISELDAHLLAVEDMAKRDHRKLGARLDMFHFQDEAPGSVFWHPNGWTVFLELIAYMRSKHQQEGYVEINTPDVMDKGLWETSGHWSNYKRHMFTIQTEDNRALALKPMNCPGATALFKHGLKSYRDLPIRMAEFGKVHRYEPSGSLHGLMRTRHFTQDDAHIFCTTDQMNEECRHIITLVLDIYRHFGFDDVSIKLSTRPKNKIGSDALWDILEQALSSTLEDMSLPYTVNHGEGAFYGPKLEFVLCDAIGRDWQCGTLQVDLNLPERFDISYTSDKGDKTRPVLIHRALFGSLERFIGVLLEHYSGALPAWLSPIQIAVLTIHEGHIGYASDVIKKLRSKNFRVVDDFRSEKIGLKIRQKITQLIPYLLVIGDKELAENTVSVRSRGSKKFENIEIEKLASFLG